MKKLILLILLTCGVTINAQEIKKTKPIKTLYKSFIRDFIVKSTSDGEGFVFKFRDERYKQLKEFEYIYFKDKGAMLHFFKKIEEIQLSPKTDKTVDITLNMNDQVVRNENKDVNIIRRGDKQWLTYIYNGKGYYILANRSFKRIVKKIRKNSK